MYNSGFTDITTSLQQENDIWYVLMKRYVAFFDRGEEMIAVLHFSSCNDLQDHLDRHPGHLPVVDQL